MSNEIKLKERIEYLETLSHIDITPKLIKINNATNILKFADIEDILIFEDSFDVNCIRIKILNTKIEKLEHEDRNKHKYIASLIEGNNAMNKRIEKLEGLKK